MNNNITLKIIFGFLFLTLIGQIAFMLFYPSQSAILKRDLTVEPPIVDRSSAAISNQYIEIISSLKKGVIAQSVLENTYQGLVEEITTQGGTVNYADDNHYQYRMKVVITSPDKQFKNTAYYNDSEVKDIKVVKLVNNQEVEMTINDIKINDKISLTETLNILTSPDQSLISVKIIIYE